jgi:hypothetical protein
LGAEVVCLLAINVDAQMVAAGRDAAFKATGSCSLSDAQRLDLCFWYDFAHGGATF